MSNQVVPKKGFFTKLEDTIKGEDGQWSHRRMTVMYFIWLLTYMVFKTATGSIFPEIAWIVVSGGAGLFSGLSVWQTMVNKKRDENLPLHTEPCNDANCKNPNCINYNLNHE